MTIIVAPAAGAVSLASVAFADDYHAARGNDAWAALTPEKKEAALVRATDYISQAYGQRWQGARVTSAQALDWPRLGVVVNGFPVDAEAVPVAVANACAELALRASKGPLAPDVGRLKQSVTVGPISTTYAAGNGLTRFTAVENLLAAYLGSSGSTVRLVRA